MRDILKYDQVESRRWIRTTVRQHYWDERWGGVGIWVSLPQSSLIYIYILHIFQKNLSSQHCNPFPSFLSLGACHGGSVGSIFAKFKPGDYPSIRPPNRNPQLWHKSQAVLHRLRRSAPAVVRRTPKEWITQSVMSPSLINATIVTHKPPQSTIYPPINLPAAGWLASGHYLCEINTCFTFIFKIYIF